MQRPRTKTRTARAVFAAALAALTLASLVLAGLAASPASAATAPKTPQTTLGIWTSAEDGGSYSTVAGQHPDIANYYLAWGQQWPAQFISQAEAAGATPYIEIEPWHAGPDWNQTPSFQDITASADSADTDCTLDGSSYDTSCATWLADIGRAVGQLARPVIFTWGHEFNVAGQYPWAAGDTGSCGSSPCTPAQWVAAWNAVQAADRRQRGQPVRLLDVGAERRYRRLDRELHPVVARPQARRHGRPRRLPAKRLGLGPVQLPGAVRPVVHRDAIAHQPARLHLRDRPGPAQHYWWRSLIPSVRYSRRPPSRMHRVVYIAL